MGNSFCDTSHPASRHVPARFPHLLDSPEHVNLQLHSTEVAENVATVSHRYLKTTIVVTKLGGKEPFTRLR